MEWAGRVINSYHALIPGFGCKICSEICHESKKKKKSVTVSCWWLNSEVGLKKFCAKGFPAQLSSASFCNCYIQITYAWLKTIILVKISMLYISVVFLKSLVSYAYFIFFFFTRRNYMSWLLLVFPGSWVLCWKLHKECKAWMHSILKRLGMSLVWSGCKSCRWRMAWPLKNLFFKNKKDLQTPDKPTLLGILARPCSKADCDSKRVQGRVFSFI